MLSKSRAPATTPEAQYSVKNTRITTAETMRNRLALSSKRLEKKSGRLDKKKPVAVYCDSGYRASLGASLLKTYGFADVRNVPGSWKAWKAAGYEVEKPAEDKKASDTDR